MSEPLFMVECERNEQMHPFTRCVYFYQPPLFIERTDMADLLVFKGGEKVELPPGTLKDGMFADVPCLGKAYDKNYKQGIASRQRISELQKAAQEKRVIPVGSGPVIVPGGGNGKGR